MITLHTIAKALGGIVGTGQVLAPGPGHSKFDRSLAVFLDPNAPDLFRVHSHAGDDWRVCRDYVKARLGISDEPRREAKPKAREPEDSDRVDRALHLWREAEKASGTPAEAYLVSRGLSLAPGLNSGDVLRFHPGCPFRLEDGTTARLLAMMALFRDIITDEPCGLHRTALKPDGSGKADIPGLGNPKKMLGIAKGAAIKLSADEEITHGLGLAEGIETAMTALCAGWRPVWACGSAGAIGAFPVLAGVEELTIFGDADPTGLAAAKVCRTRWRQAGRLCTIFLPPQDGEDWNDTVRAA